MDRDFFSHNEQATRAAFAAGLGCDVDAFAAETLTVVDRPASSPYPYTCAMTTFGTGTVLTADPEYRAFIEAQAPAVHYRAMDAALLKAIVDEGARRGVKLGYQTPGLGFALASRPQELVIPAGYEFRMTDAAWMEAEQPRNRFGNGVGEPGGQRATMKRNQFAAVLFDAVGEPAAVAGVFTTYGLLEVGIDVLRAHRGRGLAPFVVNAAVREILARGGVPFYDCGTTNVRSHRTAEASGFAVVMSDAFVSLARSET